MSHYASMIPATRVILSGREGSHTSSGAIHAEDNLRDSSTPLGMTI
jgi:hypothetical protein